MNIMHFGCNYLPNNGGNVIRMRMMLENTQSHDNVYLLTTAENSVGFDDCDYYNRYGVKIIRVKSLREASKMIVSLVELHEIDIVVTHTIPANVIACRQLPGKVVIFSEVHSLIQSARWKMIGKNLLHRLFLNHHTRKFFVLSFGAKEFIMDNYKVSPERIIYLPNGYEKKEVQFQSGNPAYFTFGYVGTFYSWQGIDLIYESIDSILGLAPEVRLYLVGYGAKLKELMEIAQKPKYREKLVVIGEVANKDVAEHMKEIDVLLIPRPSTLETETAIPLKLFEALSFGKPVIISRVRGLLEVLDQNSAFVFNQNEPGALWKVCKYVYYNSDECHLKVEKALKVLALWPSWEEIRNRQRQVFLEILK